MNAIHTLDLGVVLPDRPLEDVPLTVRPLPEYVRPGDE